jgi:lipoprotein-releasing system permease protein
MRFEFFLAKRFLTGQRFGVFRLITTIIAIGGIALGVAALIITLAVVDGIRTDIQEKILGTQPHIVLRGLFDTALPNDPDLLEQLKSVEHIEGAAPYIDGQSLIQSPKAVTGMVVRGIIPAQEAGVTRISNILIEGSWEGLDDKGIVLGKELAATVAARVGQTVTLVAPDSKKITWGQMPRMRPYKVVGIFQSGMYTYDANLAYLTIGGAQELLGMKDGITGYGMRLDSLDFTVAALQTLQERFGNVFFLQSWQDYNKPLFSAMKLERTMMFIIVTLIILVASFTVISNLLLLTIEKAREIGILQAIGASPQQISRIFLLHGFMLGGSGVSLGLLLGIGISAFLKRFPIIRLPADVYYVDKLPIRLDLAMIESVAICAFGLVLLSILYPAHKASQMDPVQAIRNG